MAKKSFKFDSIVQKAERQRSDSAEEIRRRIRVEPEFKALIPPLAEGEFAQLEENILQEGCRDALIVWNDGENYVLIDGHNRHNICKHYGLDFKVQVMDFADRSEAKDWMIRNQLGRRNLTPEQQSYLRGKRYENEKGVRGGFRGRGSKAQNEPLTAERLASEYSVSRETIKRDEKFARGVDRIGQTSPDLKRRVLAGESSLKKGDISKAAELPEDAPPFDSEKEFLKALKGERPKPKHRPKEDSRSLELDRLRRKVISLLYKAERERDEAAFDGIEEALEDYKRVALSED